MTSPNGISRGCSHLKNLSTGRKCDCQAYAGNMKIESQTPKQHEEYRL